jgi:hypothetical protein
MLLLGYSKGPNKSTKYGFLMLGLIGQALLFHISYQIYRSQQIWYSFTMYALLYVVFIFSFTSMDMFLYLENPMNFVGRIEKENIHKMFVDFVYINFSTVSTMGYSDITPGTTMTRGYSSYKIATAIFMIVFLVSDINIKIK